MNPRENGEVESFMKKIKKSYQISKILNVNFEEELKRQLQTYRGTPHSVTLKSPAELAGKVNFAINQLGDSDTQLITTPADREEVENLVTQQKAKNQKSGRNVKPHSFKKGDKVIVRRDTAKTYQPTVMEVTNVKGQTITAQDSEGKEVRQNSEWFKRI